MTKRIEEVEEEEEEEEEEPDMRKEQKVP